MVMDVNNGCVFVMQGGFSYEQLVFNCVIQVWCQSGFSFKFFVYVVVLDSGYFLVMIVIDVLIEIDMFEGLWWLKNLFDKFYGFMFLWIGIEYFWNFMIICFVKEIGMEIVVDYVECFGVYDDMNFFFVNFLGFEEIMFYKMVVVYVMFVNGGEWVEFMFVDCV